MGEPVDASSGTTAPMPGDDAPFTSGRESGRRPWWRAVLPWVIATVVGVVLYLTDELLQPVVKGFANRESTGEPNPQVTNLFDALRPWGKWPTLLLAGVALARLHPHGRRWALLLAGSAIATALVCEVIWRSVSRVRPDVSGGKSEFLEPFLGFTKDRQAGGKSGPSFPSSEAAVGMAAAWVLAGAAPRLRWMFLAIGVCVALLRVEAGRHFPADVWFGGMVGTAVAWAAMHRFAPKEPRTK